MSLLSRFSSWFGRGGALGESAGVQNDSPSVALGSDLLNVGVDGALQLSTVWACIDRRATTVASLPFFVYASKDGQRTLARDSRLYALMSDSPNARMTPFEFWRCMVMNHDLRGNAYARVDRDQQFRGLPIGFEAGKQRELHRPAVILEPEPTGEQTIVDLNDSCR